ncbi:hypothetical protein HBI82_001140 [Parastagonospora nodorum]|nr:hypothetical protein HBH77_026360 [Parastagonospora nodorum]KAH6040285.1 hypothetical protein HBI82_001140 [Parastagonospora nodorum]
MHETTSTKKQHTHIFVPQSNMSTKSDSKADGKIAIPRLERARPPPPPPPKSTERRPEDQYELVRRAESEVGDPRGAPFICRLHPSQKLNALVRPRAFTAYPAAPIVYMDKLGAIVSETMDRNQALASLLRDMSERVSTEDRRRIRDALKDTDDDLNSQDTKSTRRLLGKRSRVASIRDEEEEETEGGEAYITASAGSNENLDHLGEDLLRNRESREVGYVGQNSEVQWLSSVQRQTEHTSAEPRDQSGAYGPPGTERKDVNARSEALHERRRNAEDYGEEASSRHAADTTFYLDSDEIDFDIVVDAYADPEADVAKRLFDCYIDTVHPFFPLVPENFREQFHAYHSNLTYDSKLNPEDPDKNKGARVPKKWRAQLNLLFAIGAKHSHLVGAEWAGAERDDTMYMLRAIYLLGLKDSVMFVSEPTIEIVQATGTLALYFLVIGYVSRAWIMIGVSIRLALALGLHLRNEDPKAEVSRREMLGQTWWTLHRIECLISAITGRPPTIGYEDCTVSIPGEQEVPCGDLPTKRTNIESDTTTKPKRKSGVGRQSASPDRYVVHHIKITIIIQEVLINLYSPRTAAKSWLVIQSHMSKSLDKLKEWQKEAIPTITRTYRGNHKAVHERQQFLLKTDFWSTKMLITRPCLCRIQQRIPNESTTSANLNASNSEQCVEAAMEMAKLFPDEPDLDFIYSQGPWWSVNHIIMQCIAVLLLDVTFQHKDIGSTNPRNIASIKKMMRWLHAMKDNDPVSQKADKVLRKILRQVAPSLQTMAKDLLAYNDGPTMTWQDATYQRTEEYSTMQNDDSSQLYGSMPPPNDQGMGADFLQHQQQQNQEQQHSYGFGHGDNQFSAMQSGPAQMPFGNPFFTPFDQNAPFANMQNPWADLESFNEFDLDWASLNMPQDEQAGMDQDQDQDMDYGRDN